MSHEWLLIALPIIFALGWFAARLDIRHIRNSAAALPQAYLRGLTELLNGNEAKALDAFSDIPQTDNLPPAVQFTVGELSRRRGDYRRALKTHQQLHENEKLSEADRNRALWELAQDCAAMGFADAAEQHARLLAQTPHYRDLVFDFLIKNYQMRRRYNDALNLIKNADEDVRQLQKKTAAHLYCRLALADKTNKVRLLEEALALNPACAHARILLIDCAQNSTPPQPQQVIAYCNAIADDTPEYLWLVADALVTAYQQMEERARGQQELLRLLEDFPTPMLFKTVIALLETESATVAENSAESEALQHTINTVIKTYVVRNGGMQASMYFIERQTNRNSGHDSEQWLAVKQNLLNARGKSFSCDHCFYEMNHFSWQCPCCLNWESFKQRQQ